MDRAARREVARRDEEKESERCERERVKLAGGHIKLLKVVER